MGPIQTSLNQLSLSILGAAAGIAKGFKGDLAKAPQKSKTPTPKAETNWNMGNIAKIGRNTSNTNSRSYAAAAKAVLSGNDAISQKSFVLQDPVKARLAQVKAATSWSPATDLVGGKK